MCTLRHTLRWWLCGWLGWSPDAEPLKGCLNLRLDAGEVGTPQRDHDFMAVQGGFQGNTDRCLWERDYRSRYLGWLAWRGLLALGVGHLGLGQLLCTSGNSRAQPMLTKIVGSFGEVLTAAMAVDDVIRRVAVGL